jgi:hypothetical protein
MNSASTGKTRQKTNPTQLQHNSPTEAQQETAASNNVRTINLLRFRKIADRVLKHKYSYTNMRNTTSKPFWHSKTSRN